VRIVLSGLWKKCHTELIEVLRKQIIMEYTHLRPDIQTAGKQAQIERRFDGGRGAASEEQMKESVQGTVSL